MVKSDNRRELFDRNKIIHGMQLACTGRKNISIEMLDSVAQDIERMLYNRLEKEVDSRVVGELVMDRLKAVDHVAYVRFASVYRQFEDATQFKEIVDMLRRRKTHNQ